MEKNEKTHKGKRQKKVQKSNIYRNWLKDFYQDIYKNV